jgi:hypothetical protein
VENASHGPGREVKSDGVRMQHANGMGKGPSGDFGIESQSSANRDGGRHPDRTMSHTPMGDGQRAAPPATRGGARMMGTQAAVDHGPHQVRHGDADQHAGYTGSR